MNTYYQILGLEPGASPLEIKKAYFKLIRQHSPESDPEQFQKIREAYEQLKNAGGEPQGPVFAPLSEAFAEKMLAQIENARRMGDSVRYRDTAEEAWKLFPKDIQFLYHLIIAQRLCGNTGKAVKNAELLVKKEPHNKWFQRELAVSYIERGYTQKAYWACEKAYELGCRDMDFVLMYARECDDYGEFATGKRILFEMIHQDRHWGKEDIPELLEAYIGLLEMIEYDESYDEPNDHFSEVIESLCYVVEQYGLYMEDYVNVLFMAINHHLQGPRSAEEYAQINKLITVLGKFVHTETSKLFMEETQKELWFQCIENDPKYSNLMQRLYEACFYLDENPRAERFAILDCRLCMIEERESVLQQGEWIRQEFPAFYEKIQPYLKELRDKEAIENLKNKLQESYRQIEPGIEGGYYYKEYPEEKRKAKGRVISDGMSEQPYVRTEKKIGRNDPCPCGSGKKYKNCCMKKTG